MLASILGWISMAGLVMLLGASVYVSFFLHREPQPPAVRPKRKLAFEKAPRAVNTAEKRHKMIAA